MPSNRYSVCSAANAHLVMDDIGCRIVDRFPAAAEDAAHIYAQDLNNGYHERAAELAAMDANRRAIVNAAPDAVVLASSAHIPGGHH